MYVKLNDCDGFWATTKLPAVCLRPQLTSGHSYYEFLRVQGCLGKLNLEKAM